jgi:hypothetical protein
MTVCGKHLLKCSQTKEDTQLLRPVIVLGYNSFEKFASLGSNSRNRPIHDVARSKSGVLATDGERSILVVWEHSFGCHCVQS